MFRENNNNKLKKKVPEISGSLAHERRTMKLSKGFYYLLFGLCPLPIALYALGATAQD